MSVFQDELEAEIEQFSESKKPETTALIFSPTLTSYARFQLHQFVESGFGDRLATFSVGEGRARRLVIGWKADLDRRAKEKEGGDNAAAASSALDPKPDDGRETAAESTPTISPSRGASSGSRGGRGARRPDRAVYVPRGRRGGGAGRGRGGGGAAPPEEPAKFPDPLDEIKDNLGPAVELVESSVVVPIAEDFCYYDRVPAKPECVAEVHDFPESHKTADLKGELNAAGLRNKYELRWVDDTHAIAIFHTRAAAEAALAHDGFRSISLRPLEAATPASREKADLCISKAGEATAAAALAGPRPETSTLIARRMLRGALGAKFHPPGDLEQRERDKLDTARQQQQRSSRAARDD